MDKINYITGLKGICAIGVFLHHFYLRYYTCFNFGGLENPKINFLVNGNFIVCLFIVISAYLTCYVNDKKSSFHENSIMLIKRYLRIMFPVTPIVIIYYLCYIFLEWGNCFTNEYPITFGVLIRNIFLSPIGYNNVVGVLWMMKYIYWGTFIALIINLTFRHVNLIGKILTIGISILLFYNTDFFYLPVIGGCVFYNLKKSIVNMKNPLFENIIGILSITIGLYCLQWSGHLMHPNILINVIVSILIFGGILFSSYIQGFLNNRLLIWLGEISMGIYLIHNLVIAYFLNPCYHMLNDYIQGALGIMLVLSLFFIIGFAWIYNKGIEKPSNMIIKKILLITTQR